MVKLLILLKLNMNRTIMTMGDKLVAVRRTFKTDTQWINVVINEFGGEVVAKALGGEKLIRDNTKNLYYLIDEIQDVEWEDK
jgi:hypothetical protein